MCINHLKYIIMCTYTPIDISLLSANIQKLSNMREIIMYMYKYIYISIGIYIGVHWCIFLNVSSGVLVVGQTCLTNFSLSAFPLTLFCP